MLPCLDVRQMSYVLVSSQVFKNQGASIYLISGLRYLYLCLIYKIFFEEIV